MAKVTTQVDYHVPLTVLCAALAKLRGDLVWHDLPENIPTALSSVLNRAGLGIGCYQHWGKRVFHEILDSDVSPEVRICVKLCSKSEGMIPNPNYDYLKMWSQTIALDLRDCLAPILRSYELSDVVEVILFPLSLCPPPQVGRFGAISQDKSRTIVMLGFGVPDAPSWHEYQLTVQFLAFGALYYIARKWLEIKCRNMPEEMKKEIVNQASHYIPAVMLGLVRSPGKLALVPWLESLWDKKEVNVGWHLLDSYLNTIQEAWPYRVYQNSILINPGSIWQALAGDYGKMRLKNPHNSPIDLRWLSDFCSSETQTEPYGHSLVVVPWESQLGRQKCRENGILLCNEQIKSVPPRFGSTFSSGRFNRTSFAVDSIIGLILDRPSSNEWSLVFLSPRDACAPIDVAAVTHIESSAALFDLETGFRVA